MKATRNKANTTRSYKDAAIEHIAADLLGIETLEPRGRDALDFHEIGVWQVKAALAAAFEAGRQTSR